MDGSVPAPGGGERRPVTAVFADLVDSTRLAEALDPEDWAEILNRLYRSAAEVVGRYGGTVTQFSGDAIVALFGAPVAHEDDPERAVRAALDLVAAVADLSAEVRGDLGEDLRVRVGVNTGLAVVGAVGGPGHEEYTALGDAVNVAARMQTAARPGTVLATDATYGRVAGIVDAVDRGLLEVKGKSEPARAYEIRSVTGRGTRRGIPGLRSPMVGRARELTRLRQLIDMAGAGVGRVALVLGEPGIGKSRLLAELRADSPPVAWVEGRCVSYGHALPYHLVRELVRACVEADSTDRDPAEGDLPPAAIPDRLRDLLGGDRTDDPEGTGDAADCLLYLLGLPIGPAVAARLASLSGAAVRRHYVDALRALLARLADGSPAVVVCEDLHWADAASVDLLADLAQRVDDVPVALVATMRPDRDTEGWRFVDAARTAFGDALAELRLEPLSPDDSRSLFTRLLEIESLPGHVRRLVLDKTDGNPFFLEEVVRTLIDQGVIVRRGERWVAVDAGGVDLPDSVQGLLLSRIDRLTPDSRHCLQLASVVGRTFAVGLLRRIVGADEARVPHHLGELEANGLVTIAQISPALAYAFRHALVQEVAYSRLLRRQRQRVHRQVADALEQAGEADAALLAHHLDQAGEHDRAIPYLLTAGFDALERYALREAFGLLDRVGALLADRTDDVSVRQRVEAGLGRTQAGFTFTPGNEEVAFLEGLLSDAERTGDDRMVGRVQLWAARARLAMGEWYAGSPQLRAAIAKAREIGERLGDDELIAMPLGIGGSGKYAAGRFREAVADLAAAVDLLERGGHITEAADFANFATMASARLGDFPAAEAWYARARRLAARSGDPTMILDTDLAVAVLESERGNVEVAMEHAESAVEQANEVGNVACALVGSFFLGDQHLRLGDPAAAIPPLERSNELAQYCNAGAQAALSEAWLAAARVQAGGDLAAELDGLTTSLETAELNGDRFGAAEIHRHRAILLAAEPEPDWDAVLSDFDAAVATLDEIEARPALSRTLHDYGIALEAAGRDAEATGMIRRAADISGDVRARASAEPVAAGSPEPSRDSEIR